MVDEVGSNISQKGDGHIAGKNMIIFEGSSVFLTFLSFVIESTMLLAEYALSLIL